MQTKHEEIKAPITDNQTWNTCPKCGSNWCDDVAVPGLLHRTKKCERCSKKNGKH